MIQASIVGEPWLQTHFFGWPLDELSVLMVVANIFAHANRRADRRPCKQAVVRMLKSSRRLGNVSIGIQPAAIKLSQITTHIGHHAATSLLSSLPRANERHWPSPRCTGNSF